MKSFLNRIDQYLLKNYPLVWGTRIHYFFVWWLLGSSIIFLGILAQDPLTYERSSSLFGWLVLLSICGLVLWLVFFFRFNKWKVYGNYKFGESLALFGLCFLIVGMLVSVPHMRDLAHYTRTNIDYSDADIVKDINDYNLVQASYEGPDQLMRISSIPNEDTASFMQSGRLSQHDEDDSLVVGPQGFTLYYFTSMTKIRLEDDVIKRLDKKGLHILSGRDIYYRLKAYAEKNRLAGLDGMGAGDNRAVDIPDAERERIMLGLKRKYGSVNESYENGSYRSEDYGNGAYGTERVLNRIADAKFLPNLFSEINLRINFYVIFCICLLLYVFKNTTLKTFGISAAVAVLLPFLILLLAQLLKSGNDANNFIIPFLFYLLFAGLALSIFGKEKRNIFHGIALNFFTVCTPFIGIYLGAWYYTSIKSAFNHSFTGQQYPQIDEYLRLGEMIGLPLFFLLLEPLFQKLYLRWYALPEE